MGEFFGEISTLRLEMSSVVVGFWSNTAENWKTPETVFGFDHSGLS